MVGTVDVGPQNFDVSVKQIRVFNVEHLEDADKAFVVQTDSAEITLTVETPVHDVEIVDPTLEVELLNPFIEVSVQTFNPYLTEYDQALLMMYAYYGDARSGRDVLYDLDELVRINLYRGTNGIIT